MYSVYISIITPQVIPNKSFILCSPCLHRSPCARVCVLHSLTVTNHSQNSHTVRIRFSDCTKYLNVYIGNVVYTNLLKTLWYKSKIHACILQQKCFKKQLYKLQHWLITECYHQLWIVDTFSRLTMILVYLVFNDGPYYYLRSI